MVFLSALIKASITQFSMIILHANALQSVLEDVVWLGLLRVNEKPLNIAEEPHLHECLQSGKIWKSQKKKKNTTT